MKGSVHIKIRNNRVQYKFTLNRNVTILCGNSGTGKTTLIDMVETYTSNEHSGITLECEKNCVVLSGRYWQDTLKHVNDSIVFIDEGNEFLLKKEFAETIKKTDNYYVIATRNPLPHLPYSVDEIYSIANTNRGYGQVKRLYSQFRKVYTPGNIVKDPDIVIVEDAKSGYQFFKAYFDSLNIPCISAKGKSNIAKLVIDADKDANILVIADGAAFGPELERLLQLQYNRHLFIYLPESFEWIILSSALFNKGEISEILKNPSEFIESKNFFSWERFFTSVLVENTKNTYLAYKKSKLNAVYLQNHEQTEILKVTPLE